MSNVTFSYDDEGSVVVEIPERRENEKIAENEKWEPAEDRFSVDELRGLWRQFADAPDAAERLSGFADCSIPAAKELIRRFQGESSCARRATEADEERRKATTTAATEKPTESPQKPIRTKKRGRKSEIPEEEISDSELVDIPPSDLLASLINHQYEFSVIRAEGHNKSKSVIVEQFENVYRIKRTSYQYFNSFDSALQAAQKEGLKLKTFGR